MINYYYFFCDIMYDDFLFFMGEDDKVYYKFWICYG